MSFLRTSYQNYVIITSQQLTKFMIMQLENQADVITLYLESQSAGQNKIEFRGAKL